MSLLRASHNPRSDVFVVISHAEILPYLVWINTILSRKVRQQDRVVVYIYHKYTKFKGGRRLPVHRRAASLAKISARLFSSTLIGSQAPYCASSFSKLSSSRLDSASFARAALLFSFKYIRLIMYFRLLNSKDKSCSFLKR